MISIRIKAILNLAAVLGGYEQLISLPEGSLVSDLLVVLEEKYGRAFNELLHKNGNKTEAFKVQLLVNGRNISNLDGLETEFNDGDELFFLPPIGGG